MKKDVIFSIVKHNRTLFGGLLFEEGSIDEIN